MEGRRAGCSWEAAREAREAEAREISSAIEDMMDLNGPADQGPTPSPVKEIRGPIEEIRGPVQEIQDPVKEIRGPGKEIRG